MALGKLLFVGAAYKVITPKDKFKKLKYGSLQNARRLKIQQRVD